MAEEQYAVLIDEISLNLSNLFNLITVSINRKKNNYNQVFRNEIKNRLQHFLKNINDFLEENQQFKLNPNLNEEYQIIVTENTYLLNVVQFGIKKLLYSIEIFGYTIYEKKTEKCCKKYCYDSENIIIKVTFINKEKQYQEKFKSNERKLIKQCIEYGFTQEKIDKKIKMIKDYLILFNKL